MLQGNLIAAFQKLKVVHKKEGEGLFIQADSDKARDNGFTLKELGFRLDFGMKFFTQMMVRSE